MKLNKILAIIIILTFIWIYCTSNNTFSENFLECPFYEQHMEQAKKWGNQWYYDNNNSYNQIIPSIVNYDDSNYNLPTSSLQLLKEQYDKQMKFQYVNKPEPQNYTEKNIDKLGAPLHEILKQDINLMETQKCAIDEQQNQTILSENESILQELKSYKENEIKSPIDKDKDNDDDEHPTDIIKIEKNKNDNLLLAIALTFLLILFLSYT